MAGKTIRLGVLVGACVLGTLWPRAGQGLEKKPELTFEHDIRPILKVRCMHCHGESGEKEGGLDLRLRWLIVQGGDSGPAIVPGAPGVSIVLLWPTFQDHPGKLSPLERAAIWSWIQAGAPQH